MSNDDGVYFNEPNSVPPESTSLWTEEEEKETHAVFQEVMHHLPDGLKYQLLLEALNSVGPDCLDGLEDARDAIIYSASRRDPSLMKLVVRWTGEGEGGEEEEEEELEEDAGIAAPPYRSGSFPAARTGAVAGSGGSALLSGAKRGHERIVDDTGASTVRIAPKPSNAIPAANVDAWRPSEARVRSSIHAEAASDDACAQGGSATSAAADAEPAPPGSLLDVNRFVSAVLASCGSDGRTAVPLSEADASGVVPSATEHAGLAPYVAGMSAAERDDLAAAQTALRDVHASGVLELGSAVFEGSAAPISGWRYGSAGPNDPAHASPRADGQVIRGASAAVSGMLDDDDDADGRDGEESAGSMSSRGSFSMNAR